jgi:hypothetical protein
MMTLKENQLSPRQTWTYDWAWLTPRYISPVSWHSDWLRLPNLRHGTDLENGRNILQNFSAHK